LWNTDITGTTEIYNIYKVKKQLRIRLWRKYGFMIKTEAKPGNCESMEQLQNQKKMNDSRNEEKET